MKLNLPGSRRWRRCGRQSAHAPRESSFATVSFPHRSTTELDVREYRKDGAVRGHVLGAAEEINLQLEDHLLNLQTMSGSRFVGRYAQKVRTWEKTLNLVVETLEVWYNVQRKWMYLESIFIGSEDIRMQLPEEAKKFDLGVLKCCGAFTSLMRLVAIRRGRGWFIFRV